MMQPTYTYQGLVLRWVDGDTVDLEVDMGFRIWTENRFRLYGIDTPERGQEGYAEATAMANELAPYQTSVIIKTYKAADKYGRWLADIYTRDVFINLRLIQLGLAKPYFGGTK